MKDKLKRLNDKLETGWFELKEIIQSEYQETDESLEELRKEYGKEIVDYLITDQLCQCCARWMEYDRDGDQFCKQHDQGEFNDPDLDEPIEYSGSYDSEW